MPSHESEALEDKQKLQMKTFSELAECLARIPPKITLYGLLFKYNYVGCLLLLMFSNDLLFSIKRDAYRFHTISSCHHHTDPYGSAWILPILPVIINYGPLSFQLEKCLNRNLQKLKQ